MDNFNASINVVGFLHDTVYLAGIPLLIATVAGLFVAILQAMTQIQDQNLSQTVKIVTIITVFLVFGTSLVQPLLERTEKVMSELGRY